MQIIIKYGIILKNKFLGEFFMKKFICLFMAIIMLVSLCGCLGGTEDVRGDINSGSSNSDKPEAESKFSLGETAANTYKNDFLGISCTLPEGWTFYTDEQIMQLNNLVGDIAGEELASKLENANIIYDMYATNEGGYCNMNVNLEKLSAAQLLKLDIKKSLESQFDGIKSSYQNMGYTDIVLAYEKITVDGKEFDGITINAKIQGVNFYSTVFCFKKGTYLANVTIACLQTDKIDTILDYFTIK